MLALIALGALASGVFALYPANTWLQVGPVMIGLLPAAWALRRWPVSDFAAGCICAFVLLHLFAACWSYSYVPYDAWLKQAFRFDFDTFFGFHRNMFDRLVHLLFGILLVPAASEVVQRHAAAQPPLAAAFALCFVFGTSSLYEIFEWSLTMALSPADAGAYNGEQGDPFDSQKDMACAAVGAILAVPLVRRQRGLTQLR